MREVLLTAPGRLAESNAGPALAKILGERALPDLCDLVLNAPKQVSREGAAYGLGRLGSPRAEEALIEAVTTGRVRWHTAAGILARIPIAPQRLGGLLRSGEDVQLLLASEIVSVALHQANDGQITWIHDIAAALRPMVRGVLLNPALSMAPRKRAQLQAWVSQEQ